MRSSRKCIEACYQFCKDMRREADHLLFTESTLHDSPWVAGELSSQVTRGPKIPGQGNNLGIVCLRKSYVSYIISGKDN